MKSVGASGAAALFEAECLFDFFFVNAVVFRHLCHGVTRAEAANDYIGTRRDAGKHRPPKRKSGVDHDGFGLVLVFTRCTAKRE